MRQRQQDPHTGHTSVPQIKDVPRLVLALQQQGRGEGTKTRRGGVRHRCGRSPN
jgi:hypothetical protein